MQRQTVLVGTVIYRRKSAEPVHKATQEEILAELEANGFTEERLERIFVETERNNKYFLDHECELFERYPDQILLIYSGGIVEPFDNIYDLVDRREELDPSAREGAITRQQQRGIWIL